MKIITKAEAKKQGLTTYYTGKPCPRGHNAPRYVNGKCIECNRERNKLRPKTGKTAKTGKTTKSKAVAPIKSEPINGEVISGDWRFYADKITAALQKTVESIIETRKLLIEAKAKVDHGDWLKLVEKLPFGEDTAQRLMAIACHPVISKYRTCSAFTAELGLALSAYTATRAGAARQDRG